MKPVIRQQELETMGNELLTIPSTEDDAEPFDKSHGCSSILDRHIQKTLLATDEVNEDPQPTTSAPIGRLTDYDIRPWSSGSVHQTRAHSSTATSPAAPSVFFRTRGEPRTNNLHVARSTANRCKEIPFCFRHHVDPARQMEQYRRDYTYANLDTLQVGEVQLPMVGLPLRVPQTTSCQIGRTDVYAKYHGTSSIDFQDNHLESNPRPVTDSTSVDRFSRPLRNPEDFEWQTSGSSSMNKFWTFDANHVLPAVISTVGLRRTRGLGGGGAWDGQVGGSAAAFSGKEARHFPGNGYPIDDQSVKRMSSRVSNLQLPIGGLRAIDLLTHTNPTRVKMTQQRPLGVSTSLPVLR